MGEKIDFKNKRQQKDIFYKDKTQDRKYQAEKGKKLKAKNA